MRIEYVSEKYCSDFDGPALDIYPQTAGEYFDIGILFEKMVSQNKCVWRGKDHIRIPIINMSDIGLAVLPNKS